MWYDTPHFVATPAAAPTRGDEEGTRHDGSCARVHRARIGRPRRLDPVRHRGPRPRPRPARERRGRPTEDGRLGPPVHGDGRRARSAGLPRVATRHGSRLRHRLRRRDRRRHRAHGGHAGRARPASCPGDGVVSRSERHPPRAVPHPDRRSRAVPVAGRCAGVRHRRHGHRPRRAAVLGCRRLVSVRHRTARVAPVRPDGPRRPSAAIPALQPTPSQPGARPASHQPAGPPDVRGGDDRRGRSRSRPLRRPRGGDRPDARPAHQRPDDVVLHEGAARATRSSTAATASGSTRPRGPLPRSPP